MIFLRALNFRDCEKDNMKSLERGDKGGAGGRTGNGGVI